ncbi:MAG: 2-phospho-L-lactate guanylyltransferase [Ardenticatenaceae bacterium]|nr:2-phospho-L-lactate guanylyltransferase [Ardenticatenaceae bacterium]MCB9446322.1 2-phospho-L-lactate guanylyltransferase [Ardenticatenaceae bacterium]
MSDQHSAFSIQHSVWAIVPVKSLHESKRRLAHILSAEERAELIHHFLIHTLTVLNESEVVDQVLVISSDEQVLATARVHGAMVLVETAVHGLNPAVTQAVQFAADEGATAVLILPADLPFIEKQDVAIMVAEKKNNPNIVICSDDKGLGTNALLISPPNSFSFHYGTDSFQQHLQEAQQRSRTISIIDNCHLQFDLDTEADWHKYQLTIHHSSFTI